MAYNHPRGACYILDDNTIFIPIPKNASTSIRHLFPDYEYANFIENPKLLEDKYVFCIIREPVNRLIAAYFEIIAMAHQSGNERTTEQEFYKIWQEPHSFMGFIDELERGFFDAHVEPQVFYITTDESMKQIIPITDFWSMDNMDEKLQEKFGITDDTKHSSGSNAVSQQRVAIDVDRILEEMDGLDRETQIMLWFFASRPEPFQNAKWHLRKEICEMLQDPEAQDLTMRIARLYQADLFLWDQVCTQVISEKMMWKNQNV